MRNTIGIFTLVVAVLAQPLCARADETNTLVNGSVAQVIKAIGAEHHNIWDFLGASTRHSLCELASIALRRLKCLPELLGDWSVRLETEFVD